MAERWVPTKPNFGPPPPGYIAGLGRGATGFITRTDLGPARSRVDQDAPLFEKNEMDEEDRQAEEAYDFCQKRMAERRLKPNEIKPTEPPMKINDLKRDLSKISYQQWENIPEVQPNPALKIGKKDRQHYVPTPDSLIVSFMNQGSANVQQRGQQSMHDYRQAKSMMFNGNLDKVEKMVQGRSAVDRQGYLTQLDTGRVNEERIGDLKRARLLHKSALISNPKNPDLWLSASRIEELDGRLQDARDLLRKGISSCPQSEDIWIELSRIERADQTKNVLIQGLRRFPTSEKLWLAIACGQHEKELKSKTLRKGLENNPKSVKLWRQLIDLEDVSQAKNLLYKAVECLPKQIDLWIGLAKLETYDNAKLVINKARKANPMSLQVWIAGAKLEESQTNVIDSVIKKIQTILTKGREILKKNGKELSRNEWLEEALYCQRSENLATCEAIVKISFSMSLTEEQIITAISQDTHLYETQHLSVYTTRYLYKYAILQTKSIQLLEKMLDFERRLKNQKRDDKVNEAMKFGVSVFPQAVGFWVQIIDKYIKNCSYQEGLEMIENATQLAKGADRQIIILKKVEILKIQGKICEARVELETLAQIYGQSKSMIELIRFEYQMQNYEKAWSICENMFKSNRSLELWVLVIKITRAIKTYQQCRTLLSKATTQHPHSYEIWQQFTSLELYHNFPNRARALLNQALLKNPKNEDLYLQIIELQEKYGSKKQLNSIISKAVKDCPKSGEIWGIALKHEPANTRKIKATAALNNFANSLNPQINSAIAWIFWKQNKIEKAKKWLEGSLAIDPADGSIWAIYYGLIKQKYKADIPAVLSKFNEVEEITKGRKWLKTKKALPDNWKLSKKEILEVVSSAFIEQIDKIQ